MLHFYFTFFCSSHRLTSARESKQVEEDTTVLHPHSFTGAMVKNTYNISHSPAHDSQALVQMLNRKLLIDFSGF